MSVDILKSGSKNAPKSLRPCAQDGYLLFQVNRVIFLIILAEVT